MIALSILILLVVVRGYYNYYQLTSSPSFTTGKILKLTSGGTAGGLHFKYPEYIGDYNPVMSITWPSCRKLIADNMEDLIKYEFPVVFSTRNLNNAQILIFKNQYERYGIEIPNDLKEIVNELSKCKD